MIYFIFLHVYYSVSEIFRSAAEAGPYDVLKLYNTNGSIVNISNTLHPNDVTTRYKLEVVVTHCAGQFNYGCICGIL